MGRSPCCDKSKVKRGSWSPQEDATLKNYLLKHGTPPNWISLPPKAGLKRCGKSCRLRWLNYLRPDIKRGAFTQEEDTIICNLYFKIGSRWSVIASHLPGRTDNDVKNYWNTKLKKKVITPLTTNPTAAGLQLPPVPESNNDFTLSRFNFEGPNNCSSGANNSHPFESFSLEVDQHSYGGVLGGTWDQVDYASGSIDNIFSKFPC